MSTQETAVAIRMQDLSPEYAELMVLGKVFQASGYFRDLKDHAQAVTKILFGRELGFSPIISISGIHIIEGKPALSSNLMATLIKRSGKYDYRVKTWTDAECVLTFREKNGSDWEDVGESSFTIDDAKRAGVVKPGGSWIKYPKAMLFARSLSQGLRTYCPDVSAAPIYNPEEMGATVDEEGAVTELPKSARPVAVTTEDIEITGSGQPSAASHGNGGRGEGEGTSVRPAGGVSQPPSPGSAAAVAEDGTPGPPAVEAGPTIEQGQAVNFEKLFKDALRPGLRKDALKLAHEWLLKQNIVDGEGKPTAKAILKANFYEVREMAITHAASL